MTAVLEPPTGTSPGSVSFLKLEITGKCQLTCPSLDYAKAGPTEEHGSMTSGDWRRLILRGRHDRREEGAVHRRRTDHAPRLRQPGPSHPGARARRAGCSNLCRVSDKPWTLFRHPKERCRHR